VSAKNASFVSPLRVPLVIEIHQVKELRKQRSNDQSRKENDSNGRGEHHVAVRIPHLDGLGPTDSPSNEPSSVQHCLLVPWHIEFARVHTITQAADAEDCKSSSGEEGEESNTNERPRDLIRVLKTVQRNSNRGKTVRLR